LGVAYARQDSLLASGGSDGKVRLWAADSGKPLRVFSIGSTMRKPWLSIAFSPDGRMLAARGGEELRLWSLVSGELIRTWEAPAEGETALAFGPDGKELAWMASGGPLHRLDVASGKEIGAGLAPVRDGELGFPLLAYAPDGKTLALGEGKTVLLLERASGQELRRFKGHTARVASVAFSPDGFLLATGSQDGSLRLWESSSGEELLAMPGYKSGRIQVAFSPDGRKLASATFKEASNTLFYQPDSLGKDREVHLWEAATGKKTATLKQPDPSVAGFSFSHDGSRLAVGGRNSVHLWDLSSGKEVERGPGQRTTVNAVAISPDGKTIATALDFDTTIRIWDAATGTEVGDLKGSTPYERPPHLAYFPDGKTIAQASAPVQLWDPATESELHWRSANDRKEFLNGHAFAFSRDGKVLATTVPGGAILLRALDTGRRFLSLKGDSLNVVRLTLSEDGKCLAAGYADERVRLWDLASAKVRWTNPLGTAPRIGDAPTDSWARTSFLPGGKAVAGWHAGSIDVWDMGSGKLLLELEGEWTGASALTFSPDGKSLAGWRRGSIHLWETATGGEWFTDPGDQELWTGHSRNAREPGEELFAFSPDGRTLVSAACGVAHVWDLVAGGLPAKSLSEGELGDRWTELGQADARRARNSSQALVRAGRAAVAFLRSRLLPPEPQPRQDLKKMLEDLSSEDIGTRERASRDLRERATKEDLESLLAGHPSSEARERMNEILLQWSRPFATSGEGLRTSRAIQVLEGIASPEARDLLEELSHRLRLEREREDAAEALRRLPAARPDKPA
ncbi:MAG TPA: WD40 repeat domain-containing protein, partial [Planctomycetota bacterium]|nr:WD40 repeat domain-containing protein [Planctomycetota bacterium]